MTGIGDRGFLCFMIVINSNKQILEIFQSQVEDFYQTNFNINQFKKKQNKKSESSMNNMIATENIMEFKELFMQMNTLVFNKINKDHGCKRELLHCR